MQILSNLSTTSSTLILSSLSIFIFFIVINKWKKSKTTSTLKLPPGPTPVPIIGNLHLMTSPPFRCFRDLSRRYGPLMHLKLGETSAVVVSSPEIAKQMLKEHDPAFANRPGGVAPEIMWYDCSDIGFSPYGDYWRQMRKICINELLSPKMVRSYRAIRRDEAARLIDSVNHQSSSGSTKGKGMNLTEKVFSYSSSITSRAAFGSVCEENTMLIELMTEAVKMAGAFEIADLFPSWGIVGALSVTKGRLKKMRRKLDVILDGVIEEHSKKLKENAGKGGECGGSEDLIDVFLRIKGGEEEMQFPIANDNIKAVLFDMFGAGTETSSASIDWTMVELMKNPKVMAKVQAELRQTPTLEDDDVHKMKYLKLVIKESLRLHPPVPMLPRASREACQINGYDIPVGTKVMVNIWAMHRDPAFWKDPERFEPERFENQSLDFTGGDCQFLPFGTGRRMCPGITFGLATVELALAQLLYNFDWKLPEGVKAEDLDMVENYGIAASRKDKLFVVATPYQPLT